MTKPLIESEYRDQFGHIKKVPAETLQALGRLFEQGAAGPEGITPILLRTEGGRLLVPLPAHWHDSPAQSWRITLESGEIRPGARRRGEAEIILPEGLPLGYHRLALMDDARLIAETDLVIAPLKAYLPETLGDGGRIWGLAVQLYGLRSARNWGIGDFTDLADLVARAAAAGASLIGVNPLHALFPANPDRASPYSPSSRDFLNILYLDPEAIPDFAECEPARHLRHSPEFVDKLETLRATELVDYAGVAAQKLAIFELLHRNFRALHLETADDPRGLAFYSFRNERGAPLRRFALFQTLHETFVGENGLSDWSSWPAEFHDPESDAVRAFALANDIRIEFHEYLQWQAALQLAECANRTQSAGMPLGLYLDIAVGVDSNAAATWTNPSYWVSGWNIGAPPDAWNTSGQDWGLPPPDPAHMRLNAYAGFRTMLRANMANAGAIRLDHILGLMRLFWVPQGGSPRDGAYVHYPLEDLLSILALESVRHRCMVIGEDLGTVPPGFGDILHHHGILSYRLLYFERDTDGRFLPPEAWEPCAIAAVATHDLPTLAGYWTEADIAVKATLKFLPDQDAIDRARHERKAARAALAEAMSATGLDAPHPDEVPTEAVHRFLAKTISMIAMAQMEDLLQLRAQVNIPGTLHEHPNWQRKLPHDLPETFADPALQRILAAIEETRPAKHLPPPAPAIASEDILRVPSAVYRLQFHAGFTFQDATALIPYLHDLGISHIYASSYLKARPGSTHGYDISDHNALNPEIGTQAEFDVFCDTLRQNGMGHVLDFIPNHMGIGKSDNSLWLDVLEWGQASPFAAFFDINWNPRQPALAGRILVPVLGGHYGHVLERGEIVLHFDAATGTLSFWYLDHRFPLHPRCYAEVLSALAESSDARLREIINGFSTLAAAPPFEGSTREQVQTLHAVLARLCEDEPAILAMVERAVSRYAGDPGNSESFVPLHALLEQQAYRLAYWRVAADEINFRRFFDINELAALRMERPEVFEHTHQLIGRLIGEGKLQGLRLDHIDGLYDPAAYLDMLQRFAASQQMRPYDPADLFYVVVEKILAAHEVLREAWPVAGTTGYDFIALVNGLQINPDGEIPLHRIFRSLSPRSTSFDDIVHDSKILVMDTLLPSELNGLATDLDLISEQNWGTRDYTWERIRAALREVVANFRVYRSYISGEGLQEEDRRYIDWAIARARKTYTGADPEIFDFVRAALTTDLAEDTTYSRSDVLRFAMRFQQYTGPVTAKSVEDTAFYRYVRLLSLNEVGSDPARFGTSPQAFHHAMQQRVRRWPQALNASATHDTKRGEDARARLNVLSELAEDWAERVERWSALNRFRRRELAEITAPTPVDEYLIYQTLFGVWPPAEPVENGALQELRDRVREAIRKAMREAKSVTSWYNPNEDYESATLDFIDKILEPGKPNPFLDDFRGFVARAAPFGMLNSLSQTVLKLTAPGIPDCNQGTELWDHSLVDPDNRRPVDYAERAERLAQVTGKTDYRQRLEHWHDGAIKLAILAPLLRLRRDNRALFLQGGYEPVEIRGEKANHAVAFLRHFGAQRCLVVVGRLYATLAGQSALPYPGASVWGDTHLSLPDTDLRNVFTGRRVRPVAQGIPLAQLLDDLPVGVFLSGAYRT